MAGNQIASDVEVLMGAAESSYGTDPTPTEGMDIRGDVNITIDRRPIERSRVWASGSRVAHGIIDHSIQYSFQVAVGGVEDADSGVPGIHPILIGGGCSASLSGTSAGGDVEAEYTLTSFGKGSAAFYYYFIDRTSGQQVRCKLLGCRHNFTLQVNVNGEMLCDVQGQALYAEFEPVASLSNPSSYAYGVPSFMCKNVTHTFQGARRVKAWSWSPNWQVAPEESITGDPAAVEIALYRDRNTVVGGSFDPVMLSTDFAATSSFIAASRGATELAHALSFNDGTYNFAYAAPKTQIATPSSVKDGAMRRFDTAFMNNMDSAGDDEVTLTFGLE